VTTKAFIEATVDKDETTRAAAGGIPSIGNDMRKRTERCSERRRPPTLYDRRKTVFEWQHSFTLYTIGNLD